MAKTIGTYDAKSRFSEVVREVALGAEYIITKNGKKVALLTPYRAGKKRKRGCMKKYFGNISPDFNHHLDEFKEYQ